MPHNSKSPELYNTINIATAVITCAPRLINLLRSNGFCAAWTVFLFVFSLKRTTSIIQIIKAGIIINSAGLNFSVYVEATSVAVASPKISAGRSGVPLTFIIKRLPSPAGNNTASIISIAVYILPAIA